VHEADEPDVLGDFSNADVLSGEGAAEIDFPFAEAESPTLSDGDGAIVQGIVEFGQAVIGAWRRSIPLSRLAHVDRMLRANGVRLSLRMARGRPQSRKARSNTAIASAALVVASASHANRSRLAKSVTISDSI